MSLLHCCCLLFQLPILQETFGLFWSLQRNIIRTPILWKDSIFMVCHKNCKNFIKSALGKFQEFRLEPKSVVFIIITKN